jgi:hypothetical protein
MASATLAPTGLLARRFVRPPRANTLAWIGLPFLGLLSSLFVLTVLRHALLLTLWLASLLGPTPAYSYTDARCCPTWLR